MHPSCECGKSAGDLLGCTWPGFSILPYSHDLWQGANKGKSPVLGFFWTGATKGCHFLVITGFGRQSLATKPVQHCEIGCSLLLKYFNLLSDAACWLQISELKSTADTHDCRVICRAVGKDHDVDNHTRQASKITLCAAWSILSKFIKYAGMETYSLQSNKQGLEMRQHFSHTVTWWKYSHEAQLLLLGTQDKSMWIQVCLAPCPPSTLFA